MDDLISRKAAIDAIGEKPFAGTADEYDYEQGLQNQWERDVVAIKILPSAQPEPLKININHTLTEEEYKKLKQEIADSPIVLLPFAQPERKRGEWILIKGSNGKDYHKCSECLHTQDITGVKNYCAVCGADMRGTE